MTTDVIDTGRHTSAPASSAAASWAACTPRAARAARAPELDGGRVSSRGRAEAVARRARPRTAEVDAVEELFADPTSTSCTSARPTPRTPPIARGGARGRQARDLREAARHLRRRMPRRSPTLAAETPARGRGALRLPLPPDGPRGARPRRRRARRARCSRVHGAYLQDWLPRQHDDDWRVDAARRRSVARLRRHRLAPVDLVEFVAGDRIVRLAARTRTVFDAARRAATSPPRTSPRSSSRLASGALGTLLVSQMAPGRKNALVIELHGTDAACASSRSGPRSCGSARARAPRLMLRDPATVRPRRGPAQRRARGASDGLPGRVRRLRRRRLRAIAG